MRWIIAISLLSLLSVLATIDAGGNLPTLPGPGITIDESFNVDIGWYIIQAETTYGLAALAPESQREIFGFNGYNADHPPLGRLLLGISDALFSNATERSLASDARWSITGARPAAAVAFSATVFLVGWVTFLWRDRSVVAGTAAAFVLATTPRVFGHAHIASLESFIGLTFAACVFHAGMTWKDTPSSRSSAITGFLWGLALLTKIQAVLIPIPLTIWAFCYFRNAAWRPLAIVAAVGLATFFLGWPWLWLDPIGNFLEYLGRGTDRVSLNVFFAGEAYKDRTVPIVYAVIMFIVCAPLIWHLGAVFGARVMTSADDPTRRRRGWLLIGVMLFVLAFFTLPTISVYDGIRLFLVCYPLWAVLAGFGLAELCERLTIRWPKIAEPRFRLLLATAIVCPFIGLVATAQNSLNHYSLLIGGPRGAAALGFETSYWGDSLTREFWDDVVDSVPRGSTIAITPELHQFQLATLEEQVRKIVEHEYHLVSFTGEPTATSVGIGVDPEYLIAFRRQADLSRKQDLKWFGANRPALAAQTYHGVRTAVLISLGRQEMNPATD